MRPTVGEQLEGLRRILDDVVAPAVDGPYPADVLAGVVAALDALATGWADVSGFLAWDVAETMMLLRAAAEDDGTVAEAVRDLELATPDDLLDVRAWEVHQARVRGVLAELAPSLAEGPLAPRLAAHLRARADRFPIRVAQRMPGQR
jgi:hypothetical protein